MLHTVGTGQRDRSAAALVGPVRLHLASGPHGNHIIGNLRTAESCSRHRWNSGTWRPVCPAWMHLHGKPTYKRPHGDSLASSLPRRLPVPKEGHSCPPVYDPMFTLALAAADRDVDARARRPTAHDKNKAPHTSLCANPHDTDKSESKRILRRRGRGNQDFKRQTSHYMYLFVKASPRHRARPTPPIQGNHIIRRAAREPRGRSALPRPAVRKCDCPSRSQISVFRGCRSFWSSSWLPHLKVRPCASPPLAFEASLFVAHAAAGRCSRCIAQSALSNLIRTWPRHCLSGDG